MEDRYALLGACARPREGRFCSRRVAHPRRRSASCPRAATAGRLTFARRRGLDTAGGSHGEWDSLDPIGRHAMLRDSDAPGRAADGIQCRSPGEGARGHPAG